MPMLSPLVIIVVHAKTFAATPKPAVAVVRCYHQRLKFEMRTKLFFILGFLPVLSPLVIRPDGGECGGASWLECYLGNTNIGEVGGETVYLRQLGDPLPNLLTPSSGVITDD